MNALSKKIKNTTYKLGLIPLGGFVAFKGQNKLDKRDCNPEDNTNHDNDSIINFYNKDEDALVNKSIWKRAVVMGAGVFMNFIFGFIFFTAALMVGKDYYTNDIKPVKNTPAFLALKPGDQIVAVEDIKTNDYYDILIALDKKLSKTKLINLTVKRDDKTFKVSLKPIQTIEKIKGKTEKKYIIGIKPNGNTYRHRYNFPNAIKTSSKICTIYPVLTIVHLKKLITGQGNKNDLSGPVGIIYLGNSFLGKGTANFLWFIAVLMMAIGIFNLLPIPMLDGGHLMFLAIEKIRGKPISFKTQNRLTVFFLILIIILGLFVMQNDISRICSGTMNVN
jgi:regulator of sigma E protease